MTTLFLVPLVLMKLHNLSQISSSMDDSAFLSPLMIHGLCGSILEYLLYRPKIVQS